MTGAGPEHSGSVGERISAIEVRLRALELSLKELVQELRNDRHEVLRRISALESWTMKRNAVEEYKREKDEVRRQLIASLIASAVAATFSGTGLIYLVLLATGVISR